MAQIPPDVIMPEPEDPNTYCQNCGTVVDLLYCPNCGQSRREVRQSVMGLLREFFDHVFSFDSKTLRTLRPLMLKPGALTAAFMQGKRVPYVQPLRLYIFCSIVFFLSLNVFTRGDDHRAPPPGNQGAVASDQAEKAENPTTGDTQPEKQTESQSNRVITVIPDDDNDIQIVGGGFDEDSLLGRLFNEKLEEREAYLKQMAETDEDQLIQRLGNSMVNSVSKVLFVLMPIFAFFLKLLYIRREPLYVDHLIFAFHYHAFLFVLYTLVIWITYLIDFPGMVALFFFLFVFFTPPAYLFLSLKRVYDQGWMKTLVKFCVLSAAHFFSLIFVLMFSVLFSVFSI